MKIMNLLTAIICSVLLACEKPAMLKSPIVSTISQTAIFKPDFNAKLISQNKNSADYLLFLKYYNAEPLTPYFGEVWLDDKVVYKIDGSTTYDSSRNINIR